MPSAFLLKKIVAKFFFPLPLCLILLSLGLFFLVFTWRKKTGNILVVLGTLLLFLYSSGFLSGRLLRPLEYRYPPHRPEAAGPVQDAAEGAPFICVLGSAWVPDTRLPVTSRTDDAFLDRMVEGTRLARLYPDARLIVVVASPGTAEERNRFIADWSAIVGLDAGRFQLITEVLDTRDEAREIQKVTGSGPVLLVTSASHMPRAMNLFAGQGIRAVPAPCGHRTLPDEPGGFHPGQFVPYAVNTRKSEEAVYEYLGLTWEWMKRLVGPQAATSSASSAFSARN